RGSILKQTLGIRPKRWVAGISDCDQHIADEAIAAGALDRRTRKAGAESGIVEMCKLGKLRGNEIVARLEFRLARRRRKLVPRTNGETIVAAIDAITDRCAEFAIDMTLVLDREIGNAAPRIEV